MHILGRVAYAYASEGQLVSYFKAPLRGYGRWLARRIQDSKGCCAQVGWKIAYIVSAIFAYLLLAIPKAMGVLINLFAPLPTDLALIVRGDDPRFTASSTGRYSLWAISVGLPDATQDFLKLVEIDLRSQRNYCYANSTETCTSFSDVGCTYELFKVSNQYTYEKGALLAYVLYETSLVKSALPAAISGERELQLVCFNNTQRPQERLDLMPGVFQSLAIVPEKGFPIFDKQLEQFKQWLHMCSARLNWIPNPYTIRFHNGCALVVISLPDQLIPNAQRAYPGAQLRLNDAPPPLLLQSARVTT